MGLIDNPAFISAGGNVDTRTGFIFTSDAESPKILSFSCQGDIIVMSTYQGEEVEVTYSNLDHEELGIQADANTPILIVGNVTEISGIDSLLTIDLRSTRTLLELELSAADLESINLAGCRQMTKLDLSGCIQLQQLDLSQNIRLESLNLSGCSGLQQLDVTMLSELQSLDVSDCTALSYLDLTKNKKITSLNIDGTQLSSPNNTLILASLLGGGSTPEGVAMEATSQEILQKVSTITSVDSDISYGKEQLAARITNKGVITSPTDSLVEMANKVQLITQSTITIEGGELYTKQMFADGLLWNLYEVLANVKSNAAYQTYSAFIVGEYYLGYKSIFLYGADAYLTSDGAFYTEQTTHIWSDVSPEKLNRYVVYMFANSGSIWAPYNQETCPRRIIIGGHMGDISVNNARISEVIIPDEVIDGVQQNSAHTVVAANGTFGDKYILKNVEVLNSILLSSTNTQTTSVFIFCKEITGEIQYNGSKNIKLYAFPELEKVSGTSYGLGTTGVNYLYAPKLRTWSTSYGSLISGTNNVTDLVEINLPSVINNGILFAYNSTANGLRKIVMENIESLTNFAVGTASCPALELIYVPNTRSFNTAGLGSLRNLIDIEVGELTSNCNCSSWNPADVIADPEKLATLNANIREHIAANVADRTGLSALTFTVSTNLYNNLEQATIDAFAAKNWNVAGA